MNHEEGEKRPRTPTAAATAAAEEPPKQAPRPDEQAPYKPSRTLRERVQTWLLHQAAAKCATATQSTRITSAATTTRAPPQAPLARILSAPPTRASTAEPGRTLYVYDDRCCAHANLNSNVEPERPSRVSVTNTHLHAVGLLDHPFVVRTGPLMPHGVSDEHLRLVHEDEHIEFVAGASLLVEASEVASMAVGPDLYANNATSRAARIACGAVVEAVRRVCSSPGAGDAEPPVRNAFCLVRPPGHHCSCTRPSGFCFFNNVAVAVRAAMKDQPDRVKRVLVVDWDVHHGDGTQNVFYDDENVLVFSIHQHGFKKPHRVRYDEHAIDGIRRVAEAMVQRSELAEKERAADDAIATVESAQAELAEATADELLAALESPTAHDGVAESAVDSAPRAPAANEEPQRRGRARKPVNYAALDAELGSQADAAEAFKPVMERAAMAKQQRKLRTVVAATRQVSDMASSTASSTTADNDDGALHWSDFEETEDDDGDLETVTEDDGLFGSSDETSDDDDDDDDDDGDSNNANRVGGRHSLPSDDDWNNLPDFPFRGVPRHVRARLSKTTLHPDPLAGRPLVNPSPVDLGGQPSDDEWDSDDDVPFYPATGHRWLVGGDVDDKPTALAVAHQKKCGESDDGREEEPLEHPARGKNVNVPWPTTGMGDVEYLMVLQELLGPMAAEFAPDLIVVSCGFDCAQGDLLGSMNVTPSGFYAMTRFVATLCPRVVVALEGGYNIRAVATSAEMVLRALVSVSEEAAAPSPSEAFRRRAGDRTNVGYCRETIEKVKEMQRPYWRCFQ